MHKVLRFKTVIVQLFFLSYNDRLRLTIFMLVDTPRHTFKPVWQFVFRCILLYCILLCQYFFVNSCKCV